LCVVRHTIITALPIQTAVVSYFRYLCNNISTGHPMIMMNFINILSGAK
jgi:hypothetical protein